MKKFRGLLAILFATPLFALGQISTRTEIQAAAMGTEDNWMLSVAAIMVVLGAWLYLRVKKRHRSKG